MAAPRTIHDFGGFPRELYEVQYPAPGNPELACRVQEMLAPLPVRLDESWGLDHGTWSVFCHVYLDAKVPIVQLTRSAPRKGLDFAIFRINSRICGPSVAALGRCARKGESSKRRNAFDAIGELFQA